MSIMNAHVGTDEAVIVTDTRARLDDGRTTELTKVTPVVHLDAVIVGRGLPALVTLCTMILQSVDLRDFDGLEQRMPAVLGEAFQHLIRKRVTTSHDAQEVTIVGWSPSQQRMRGIAWQYRERETGFLPYLIDLGGRGLTRQPVRRPLA